MSETEQVSSMPGGSGDAPCPETESSRYGVLRCLRPFPHPGRCMFPEWPNKADRIAPARELL